MDSKDWGITTAKENFVVGGSLVANNALDVGDIINYVILAAVSVQLCYTAWKWYRDYKNHRYDVTTRDVRTKEVK